MVVGGSSARGLALSDSRRSDGLRVRIEVTFRTRFGELESSGLGTTSMLELRETRRPSPPAVVRPPLKSEKGGRSSRSSSSRLEVISEQGKLESIQSVFFSFFDTKPNTHGREERSCVARSAH